MDIKLLSLLSLLVMLSNCQGQDTTCHPHCNCTVPTDVTCENVRSIPRRLPDTVIYLTLTDNFIGPILLKIQVDQLASLPLQELYLSNNRLEAIQDGAFSELTQLQELDLSNNKITSFGTNTFVGLLNLRYLYANNAGILNIEDRAFAQTPNIMTIDLEGNRLTSIGEEFGALLDLSELLLAQNQISEISPGAFSGLTSLNHLSLFGNKLLKPMDSWFRTIIANNGKIELDFRFNSSIGREPNNWLCCPDVGLYHNFVRRLNKSLFSYPQLDVTCSWPVQISGRPISTLSMEELEMTPCNEYSPTTTISNSPDGGRETSTLGGVAPSDTDDNNFLGGLNDAGAFFLLLLFVVIGGCLVAGFSYWYKNKQGRQRLINLKNNMLRNKKDKDKSPLEMTRKTFRQEQSSYGSSEAVKRPLGPPPARPARPARPAPVLPPSALNRSRPLYSMDTDYSEEEVWSKT